MKNSTKRPRHDSDVRKTGVVPPHRMSRRHSGFDSRPPEPVHDEVSEREECRQRFLDSENSVERPFSVELEDGITRGGADGGDDVLACVGAFGRGGPAEEAAVEWDWEGVCFGGGDACLERE